MRAVLKFNSKSVLILMFLSLMLSCTQPTGYGYSRENFYDIRIEVIGTSSDVNVLLFLEDEFRYTEVYYRESKTPPVKLYYTMYGNLVNAGLHIDITANSNTSAGSVTLNVYWKHTYAADYTLWKSVTTDGAYTETTLVGDIR